MLLHNGGDCARKLIQSRFLKQPVPSRRARPDTFARSACCLSSGSNTLCWCYLSLPWFGRGFASEISQPVVGAASACFGNRTVLFARSPIASPPVVFIAISVTHLVSLIVNRRLRNHWKQMWPKPSDITEAAANLLLQRRICGKRRPSVPRTAISRRRNTGPWSGARLSWP